MTSKVILSEEFVYIIYLSDNYLLCLKFSKLLDLIVGVK